MTASKSDKAPKVMDVARPGKSAPSDTSKPIIVTNRPMLRRDPMMATPDGIEKNVSEEKPAPVARTAKPIVVIARPADASDVAKPADDKTPAPAAAASAEPIARSAAPSLPPKADDEDIKEDVTPEQAAPATDKKAVAGELGEEALTNSGLDVPSTSEDVKPADEAALEIAPSESNVIDETPAEPSPDEAKPEELMPEPADTNTPARSVADEARAAKPARPEPAADDEKQDEAESDTDGQLAPNKTLDEIKRKEDEAKAARAAELEELAASKKFYLPIQSVEQRRGLNRILMILIFVVLLAVVWADVVLDAGIVRLGGLHALTHFFSH